MTILPEKIENYSRIIAFMLKYRNSHVFNTVVDNAADLDDDEKTESDDSGITPQDFANDLKQMGPVYVKLGQLLSTRPDLLPEEYLDELANLQDDVEPIGYGEIERLIEEELGVRISKAFKTFDPAPLASASIGQVHRAELPSGKKVAVKVQRPGIRKQFTEELETLKNMVDMAVKYTKTVDKYALDDVLDELSHMLMNELDYKMEAQSLVILGQNLKEYKRLIVPQPVMDYCTPKILTMDYVEGKKVTKVSPFTKTEVDFTPLIDELVKSYLQQVVIDGFAHADPHPGNVHFTPDNKIALIDLGMVAKFSNTLKDQMLRLLLAMSEMSGDKIVDILLGMSTYDETAMIKDFRKDVNRLVLDNQISIAKDLKTGRLIIQMNRMAAERNIKIAVELNLLGKILLNIDQIIATLTPDYDFQKAINENAERLMTQKMTQELKPENMFKMLLETKKLGENLPERLNKISQRLADNEFEIKVNAIDEKRFTDGFQKVANRITVGLIIAALILAASMLMRMPTSFTILGYPGLPLIFFLIASGAGIMLVYNIISKDEYFRKRK